MNDWSVKAMTIEEAIKHCEKVADSKCDECGAEHKQLAEWLIELKKSRKAILEICWENANMSHCRNCAIRKYGVCPHKKGSLYGEWERVNVFMDAGEEAVNKMYKECDSDGRVP